MKHFFHNRSVMRKVKALILAGLMTLGCFWDSPMADASDFSINDNGFKNPQISSMTIYFWKEGLPPYTQSNHLSNKKLQRYPVLLTWKHSASPTIYYMNVDLDFAECAENNLAPFRDDVYFFGGYSKNKKDSGRKNGLFGEDGTYPSGEYFQHLGYWATTTDMLADSGLNFAMLKEQGSFVSLSIPEGIPCVTPMVEKASTRNNYEAKDVISKLGVFANCPGYTISIDLPKTSDWYASDYAGKYFYSDGGARQGLNYIVPMRVDYIENGYYPFWRWSLGFVNRNWWKQCKTWFDDRYDGTLGDTSNGITDYYDWVDGTSQAKWSFGSEGMERYNEVCSVATCRWGWWVKEYESNGQKSYSFYGVGEEGLWEKGSRTQSSNLEEEEEDLHNRAPQIYLGHEDYRMLTLGEIRSDRDWLQTLFDLRDLHGFIKPEHTRFNCYYAQPVNINFLQSDFTVESGQVTNLDKYNAIANGTTITVKDGGTLSIDGWLMNNGTIKIEEGGTLYLQAGACVNRYNDGKHIGGGISCNGTIIIDENAKLIGGGLDGIQLKNGSHVVNYGLIASENFKITNDHTIENRQKGFVLSGPGCGVINAGNITYMTALDYTNKTFAESAAVETNPYVDIAPNAIYQN